MTAILAPNGFIPTEHYTGGVARTKLFGSEPGGNLWSGISPSNTTPIYQYQPVTISGGYVVAATSGQALLGIFAGCYFTDPNGRHAEQAWWPGTTGCQNIVAIVYVDPNITYYVQADGSVPQTALYTTTNGSNLANGSTQLQISQATVSASVGAGTAQFLIVGIQEVQNNSWGDAFTILEVKPNLSLSITGVAGV